MKRSWLELCLYPEVKLHIIRYFVQNPELRNNQSEIARAILASQVSVSRHISDLVKLSVLLEERNGLSAIYRLNINSMLVNTVLIPMIESSQKLIAQFVHKTFIKLKSPGKDIYKIILFGSAARGDLRPKSDLDLLVVAWKKDKKLESLLHEIFVGEGYDNGFKINLHVESKKTFETAGNIPYLLSVKKEGVLIWSHAKNEGRK